jgi:hypothetical protein
MRPMLRSRWRHALVLLPMTFAMTATQATDAPAAVEMPPGRWTLTTQTLLPHLEEALRYATTRDERCLGAPAADTLFPVLRHEAFAGCTLVATGEVNVFALRCRNAQAASGRATIEVAGAALTAVLEIKMGGKNMTLAQRVTGTLAGRCPW